MSCNQSCSQLSAGCDANLIFTATDCEDGSKYPLTGLRIQFGMKRNHDDTLENLVVYKDSDVGPDEIEILTGDDSNKARIKIKAEDTLTLEEGFYCCSVSVTVDDVCVRSYYNFIEVDRSMFNLSTVTPGVTPFLQGLANAITNEVARATAAESTLSASISAEAMRATAAESVLSASINTSGGNLAAEVTRATTAEAALGVLITNEVTRATAAEGALSTSIGSETTRATTAEGVLNTAISSGDAATLAAANTHADSIALLQRITIINDTTIRIASATGGGYVDLDTATAGNLIARGQFGRINMQAGVLFGKNSINIHTGGVAALPLAGSRNVYRCNTSGATSEFQLPAGTDTDGTSLTGAEYRVIIYGGAKAYFRPTNAAHQVLLNGVITPAGTPQWIVGSNPGAAATVMDFEVVYVGSNTWKVTTREGTPVVTSPGP